VKTVKVKSMVQIFETRVTVYEVPDDFFIQEDAMMAASDLEAGRDSGRVAVQSEEVEDSDSELWTVLDLAVTLPRPKKPYRP